MIKIIDTIEGFEALRSEWENLWGQAHSATPFQTFDYAMSSWNYMQKDGCSLYIICYIRQKDNQLQAILPCYIDKKKTLRFINDLHTDFCDAILREDSISDFHLWEEISDNISHNSSIYKLRLTNVSSDSYLLGYFNLFLKPSISYSDNAYSIFPIDKSTPDKSFLYSLSQLNSVDRNRLKKIYNKAKNLTFQVFAYPEEYPKISICHLVNEMIVSGIREDSYCTELLTLLESFYSSGLLLVCFTMYNDQPKAVNIFLKSNKSSMYYNWLVFYQERKYNLYNILQSIEYISNEGGTINFCRGLYEYKIRNFRPQIHNLYTLRWSRSLWGQLMDVWDMCFYQFKQIVKKIIRG